MVVGKLNGAPEKAYNLTFAEFGSFLVCANIYTTL